MEGIKKSGGCVLRIILMNLELEVEQAKNQLVVLIVVETLPKIELTIRWL